MKFNRSAIVATSLMSAGLCPALLAQSSEELGPPAGTASLFDYLFSSQDSDGITQYDLPTSFEGLLAKMKQISGGEPIAVLVPMGRSVQRLDTDLKEPRIVATFSGDPQRTYKGKLGPRLKYRMFVGYGAKSDQLEVISFNEHASRFEFQIVKNLSDAQTREVVYAPRDFCRACHFHEAPMFPRNPWEETTSFPATARAVVAARGSSESYHGVDISQSNNVAYEFDRISDGGADLLMNQSLWKNGCGVEMDGSASADHGANCRADQLRLAFQYMFEFNLPSETQMYQAAFSSFKQSVRQRIGLLIFFPISDLRSRNPLSSSGGFQAASGQHGNIGTDQGTIGELKKLTTVPAELDPLSASVLTEDPYMFHPLRTEQQSVYKYPNYIEVLDQPKIREVERNETFNEYISWIANELTADFDFWNQFYDATSSEPMKRIESWLRDLQETAIADAESILRGNAINTDELIISAAAFFKLSAVESCCLPRRSGGGSGVANPDIDLSQFSRSEQVTLQHFQTYCSSCHTEKSSALPYFLGDFSLVDKDLAGRILGRIDWENCQGAGRPMPRPGSKLNDICRNPNDRKQMIETIKLRYFGSDRIQCGAGTIRNSPLPWNSTCAK